jgi:hypothetical protein
MEGEERQRRLCGAASNTYRYVISGDEVCTSADVRRAGKLIISLRAKTKWSASQRTSVTLGDIEFILEHPKAPRDSAAYSASH